MRDDRHSVGMKKMEEARTREREDQTPEHRRHAGQAPAKEQPSSQQHERVTGQELAGHGRGERQESVDREMEGVIGSRLALPREVEATEQLRHPVERFAASELFGIECAHRKVVRPKVVRRIYLPKKPRAGHQCHDRERGQELPDKQPAPAVPDKAIWAAET